MSLKIFIVKKVQNIASLVGLAFFKVKVGHVERTSNLGNKNFLTNIWNYKFSTIA